MVEVVELVLVVVVDDAELVRVEVAVVELGVVEVLVAICEAVVTVVLTVVLIVEEIGVVVVLEMTVTGPPDKLVTLASSLYIVAVPKLEPT
jgi:hypothetical protein